MTAFTLFSQWELLYILHKLKTNQELLYMLETVSDVTGRNYNLKRQASLPRGLSWGREMTDVSGYFRPCL